LKRSQVLGVAVLALLLLAAVPVQTAGAQSPYTEKLSVYIAGSSALWYFTFGGVNGSSHLSALESAPGLSWYNVTAVSTVGWQSDFQVFGPRGYDVLPVQYLPPQGIVLTVGSDSYSDAAAAAAGLDSYLLTSFVSMSNGTGTYSFYSPLSFSALVPATLLKFLPTGEGGFAKAISPPSFVGTESPFVSLRGVKSGSGFDHTLVVGSITGSALSSSESPAILTYFGSTVPSLSASSRSSSSVVYVRALDGLIQSSDPATVTNDLSSFSGSYSLTLAPGKSITGVNATVVEQPAPLLAARAINTGVLMTGSDMAVTLTFTNLSPTETISNLTFADNWWNGTSGFKLLGGTDNLTSADLAPGSTVTPVYRLEYTGSATGPFTIPASVVRYEYQVDGKTFGAATLLNPITISLNKDEAVVYATLAPVGKLGGAAGSTQSLNITVVNVGTLPASSVVVAGEQIPGLAAGSAGGPGGSATVTVKQAVSDLANVNITRSYLVTYQDPSGATLQATTNVISDVFSQTSMLTGFPTLSVGVNVTPMSPSANNVTLSFAAANFGLANVTSFVATGTLPAGLGCGSTRGVGISCTGDRLTISYSSLNASTTVRTYMTYNLTSLANYVLLPVSFRGVTSGGNVSGASNLAAVPAGIQLDKAFSPGQLFGGMDSTVTVSATNAGPQKYYNATVATTPDTFDRLTSSGSLSRTTPLIPPGGNFTFSYPVSASQLYGTFRSAPVTATFYFAGTQFSVQGVPSKVVIYQPLSATITTSPATPVEGKAFTITIQIDNPSPVPVGDVVLTLPVPAGLSLKNLTNAQVLSGVLTVEAGSLAGGANVTATATAVASSGITIPFSGAELTFSYAGAQVKGTVPSSSGIAIAENVTLRYVIPIAIILLVMLAAAFYVRRLASTAPASPK
jgi:hypothetical protein